MIDQRSAPAKAVFVCLALTVGVFSSPAVAQVVSSVKGTVVDAEGNPLPKVQVVFETFRVPGRGSGVILGKLKTRKNGSFTYPFLDPGEYKIYSQLEGSLILQMEVLSIDSQKNVHMDETIIISRKQDNFPAIPVKPQGRGALVSGRCEITFTMVKEEDYTKALARIQNADADAPTAATASAGPVVSKKRDAVERGDEYFAGGDYDQAAVAYQEAVTEDDTRADAFYGLGKSLLREDDLAGAQGALMKAARLDPELPGVNFYLATIYHSLAQEAAAIAALEKERINSPDTEEVLVNLGSIYRDTDQLDKALEVLNEVVALNPENTDAYLAMADVHNQQGRTAEAEEIYRQILASNPGQEDIIWYNIGVNAYNVNNRTEAAQAFEKSIEANPKNPDAHYMFGLTLMGLGQPKDAVPHFEKYLKLEPKGPFASDVASFLEQLR